MTPKYKISVTHFRHHTALLDELIKKLDGAITEYDYGIPDEESSMISFREVICEWLEKYGKHITLRRV